VIWIVLPLVGVAGIIAGFMWAYPIGKAEGERLAAYRARREAWKKGGWN
jgi:hypothetical protein